MRAREFIYETPSLADELRQAVAAQNQQKMGQNPPQDPNAAKTGQTTQGTSGSASPSAASGQQQAGGGTQTPQNGTQPTAPGQAQKPGVMGSFVKGLTGGKADSLGGMAKLGAAKVASGAGLKSVAGSIDQSRINGLSDPTTGSNNPQQMAAAFKPGQEIDHPTLGKVKVTKVTPQGLELDTSQSPSLGVNKLNIDLKSLANPT